MNRYVYIALDGFEETPIPLDAWLAAAGQCDDVVVVEEENPLGKICHFVMLKSDKRARLDLSPYGLVYAHNPSRELIVAMFKLANALNAGVYSERLNRYSSVDEWELRTRKNRRSQNNRRAKDRNVRRLRIALGMIFAVVLSIALSWLVVEFSVFITE